MNRIRLFYFVIFSFLVHTEIQCLPKREFRGAWIHTVWNTDYPKMSTEQIKKHYVDLLDEFQSVGINAVIYQIRPAGDAFYHSTLEPWSRFLTGEQGKAPQPFWDPLEFMIEECHKRGMELHAWFNPYRAGTSENEKLSPKHLFNFKPYLFFKYGKQLYFDPGNPESREHTIAVVVDVLNRYDIDAVHFDDYFYPYIKGQKIPDEQTFKKFGGGYKEVENWRRHSVNRLVKSLHDTIKKIKPWVSFGISPFCVERINYSCFYADVKKWMQEGTIDYVAPQLYWEIGHKMADYQKMLNWWSSNSYNCKLYIGQNIESTVKINNVSQLWRKMKLAEENPKVEGNIWWPGYLIPKNVDNFTDSLKFYYANPVLPVAKSKGKPPSPIINLKIIGNDEEKTLRWSPSYDKDGRTAVYYVIYKHTLNGKFSLNSANMISLLQDTSYKLPEEERGKYRYTVTALDRNFNESPIGKIVKFF